MIGKKLAEIRKSLEMNKKDFADYLGLKYTTYNNYETEARDPASDFLILVSNKCDVSIDYLLGQKDDRRILHAYQLASSEYSFVEQYRSLTAPGKAHVNTVLQWELEHADQLRRARSAQDDAAAEVDIDAAVEDYRRRLEREKKAREKLSASNDTGTDGR